MNIEKLGITPIKAEYFYGDVFSKVSKPYCPEEPVRELEQQRNEMLEALIDLMKGVQGLPPLTAIRGTLEKEWQYGLSVIEKACYPKKWTEIKELS